MHPATRQPLNRWPKTMPGASFLFMGVLVPLVCAEPWNRSGEFNIVIRTPRWLFVADGEFLLAPPENKQSSPVVGGPPVGCWRQPRARQKILFSRVCARSC